MTETFVLCEYHETDEGKIDLVKVEDFDSHTSARNRAAQLCMEDSSSGFVILTILKAGYDSRA